jgi:acetyltransferase EpsM
VTALTEPHRVVVLGAGGHGTVLAEAAGLLSGVKVIGFLDRDPGRVGTSVLGIPVLGGDEMLEDLAGRADTFLVGLGLGSGLVRRRQVFEHALAHRLLPLTLVHPQATLSPSAQLSAGCEVLAGSVVGPRAAVGTHATVNTAAVVEHDAVVGAHAFISPGAILLGAAQVGEGVLVGAGAVLLPGVTIGAGAVIAAGSVVTHDIDPGGRVAGVPARPLRDPTQA